MKMHKNFKLSKNPTQSLQKERNFLKQEIIKKALFKGEFILSSGKKTDYYLDLRLLTLSAETSPTIGSLILSKLLPEVEAVGGPAIGADPIVGSVVALSKLYGKKIDGFLVRKKPKTHGRLSWLEGPVKPPAKVCIVEDVVTSGKSILDAVEKVSNAGFEVMQAISLVDREEKDLKPDFKKMNIAYEPIFYVSELL